MSAVDAIRKDLKRAAVEPGTVIKFVSHDLARDRYYTYAALFIVGKWWLTGTSHHFNQVCSHAEMIAMLGDEGVESVEVATYWEKVK